MITDSRLVKISVYPPCTSLRRMCRLYRFSRLMKSTGYVLSARLRIPTPASTIFTFTLSPSLRKKHAIGLKPN